MARDKVLERLKAKHPDKTYENDEGLFEDIEGEFSTYDADNAKKADVDKQLADMFRAHPDVMRFVLDISKGASVAEAAARHLDLDDLTPVEGEPDYEAWKKGLEERKAGIEERDVYNTQLEANVQSTSKVFNDFVEANGLDEAQAEELAVMADTIFADAVDGKVEESTLAMLYAGLNKDNEVEKARVEASNKSIDEHLADSKEKNGDGLPDMDGGGKAPSLQKRSDNPFEASFERHSKRKF